MTARRSFDVAGKIAFVLWRHGQRRNGTMPTMRVKSLCLLSHRSAWIPRARSPSRIERSRTRLPVGVRSLMCEKPIVSFGSKWMHPDVIDKRESGLSPRKMVTCACFLHYVQIAECRPYGALLRQVCIEIRLIIWVNWSMYLMNLDNRILIIQRVYRCTFFQIYHKVTTQYIVFTCKYKLPLPYFSIY